MSSARLRRQINLKEGLMNLLAKTKFKNFLVVLLTMLLTLSLALCTACGDTGSTDDGDDDTTKTEETITDYQVIKNGDFEFSTTEKTDFPYSSSISWTRSIDTDKNSAPSSTVSSGIIDTATEAFNKLEASEKPTDESGNSINPGTPYSNSLITSSEYDYEDEEKRVNPQVDGSKILMIANKTSEDGLGTAQKFKSTSTISVPVNSYAIISIWVRTDNLKMKADKTPGAYVLLTDKVNSTAYSNIEYRDINTNGKWEKIETVIKGSEFSSTIFSITVGLGRGNGTFKADYVEGFAFFDNIEAKIYSASEFKALNKTYSYTVVSKDVANYNVYTTPTANNTSTYAYSYEYVKDPDITNLTPTANDEKAFGTNVLPSYEYDLTTGNEIDKKTVATLTNANIKTAVEDIGDTGLNDDASLIYFDFQRASTGYYKTDFITIEEGGHHYITFFAKTSVSNENVKMAKVSLINSTVGDETTTVNSLTSFTTTSVEDSAFGKWVKYSILVNNPTDEDTRYQIKFVFGDDETQLISDEYLLQKGYAIFAGLNVETISKDNYNVISTNSYIAKSTVYGKYSNYSDESDSSGKSDNYSIVTDQYGKFEIQTKPATYMSMFKIKGSNVGAYAGIINSKYNDNYTFLSNSEKEELLKLKEGNNEHAQVILLKDNNEVNKVNLLSTEQVITAGSITKLSLKLKVLEGAGVKVRLVDPSPNSDGSFKTLKVPTNDGEKELETTIDHSAFTLDNWTELCFFIAAGNEQLTFRVEISLTKAGTIFVNTLNNDLSVIDSLTTFDSEYEVLKEEFESMDLPFSEPLKHTRAPSTELYTDDDGNDAERTITYQPEMVYSANSLYTFAKFTTIHVDDTIDNRVVDEETEDTTTEDEDEYTVTADLGLQISSLVLALALVAVLIVVVIRNVNKKTAKRKVQVESYYDRNTRDEVMAKIAKKKANIDVSDNDTTEEYDYEEAQLVDEEETQEAQIEETSTEESANETPNNQTEETIAKEEDVEESNDNN